MTLEEFLRALIEGEAVTIDGGKTYFRNENGRRYALEELGL